MKKKGLQFQPDKPEPEQADLFIADITNWPVKDDLASMEIPLFSLAKNKDLNKREYKRAGKTVTIRPSTDGAATVFDKDLLLYVGSQIVAALNEGRPVSKTIKVETADFLASTARSDGGSAYEGIIDMLRRLRGTTVETNIQTGGKVQTKGFGMIDDYTILSEKVKQRTKRNTKTGESELVDVQIVYEFTIVISEWLYNGLINYEALTLDRKYFSISQAIERRLYEIARKHVGDQAWFKIGIELLSEKVGTTRDIVKFRSEIRNAIKQDDLPEYHIALDSKTKPNFVIFYTRDSVKLSKHLIDKNLIHYFDSLERPERKSASRQ